jgi:hypothetical protein
MRKEHDACFVCKETSSVPPPDLSKDGFCTLLCDLTQNNAFQPSHSNVYQDMTLPLTCYYVASSHNTYLSGNQLTNASTAQAIENAVLMGFRVIELDVYEGDKGAEPQVLHGGTLTAAITFRAGVRAAVRNAFMISDFPLILTLENHCTSAAQRKMMATILREECKDQLFIPPLHMAEFPSPHALRGKVLVRDKPLGNHTGEMKADEPAREYDDLVAINNVKLKHLTREHIPASPSSMSFDEDKVAALDRSSPETLRALSGRHLVRVYPKGTRVDSSNYEPHIAWQAGCQMAALNCQRGGSKQVMVSRAMFADNGGCGFVLKPPALRGTGDATERNLSVQQLFVRVISAHYLPKSYGRGRDCEIVDPFVVLSLCGVPEDCRQMESVHVEDNGFDPAFELSAVFDLRAPQLSVLHFEIRDNNRGLQANEFICSSSIAVRNLRDGYRTLPLFDYDGRRVPVAFLFVHFSRDAKRRDVFEPQTSKSNRFMSSFEAAGEDQTQAEKRAAKQQRELARQAVRTQLLHCKLKANSTSREGLVTLKRACERLKGEHERDRGALHKLTRCVLAGAYNGSSPQRQAALEQVASNLQSMDRHQLAVVERLQANVIAPLEPVERVLANEQRVIARHNANVHALLEGALPSENKEAALDELFSAELKRVETLSRSLRQLLKAEIFLHARELEAMSAAFKVLAQQSTQEDVDVFAERLAGTDVQVL